MNILLDIKLFPKYLMNEVEKTNNELKFLHCEITKLHRIIRDDDIKIRKLGK